MFEVAEGFDLILHEEYLSEGGHGGQFVDDVVFEAEWVGVYLFWLRSMADSFQEGRWSSELMLHWRRMSTLTFLNFSR